MHLNMPQYEQKRSNRDGNVLFSLVFVTPFRLWKGTKKVNFEFLAHTSSCQFTFLQAHCYHGFRSLLFCLHFQANVVVFL